MLQLFTPEWFCTHDQTRQMELLKYLIAQGQDFYRHTVCSFACLAGFCVKRSQHFSTKLQLHLVSMSQQQGRTRPIPLSAHAPCDKLTVSDSGWGCVDFKWDNHVIKVLWVYTLDGLKRKTVFQSEEHLVKNVVFQLLAVFVCLFYV